MVNVSIIVPVFNADSYIAECLDSLINQTLKDIEIICVNDGSTDSSGDILDAYARRDSRVRVFCQENRGVSSARNRGLNEAHGQYILFVDADDYISLDACERLVSIAKLNCADIVVFGGKTFPTLAWADASFAKRSITYPESKSIDALFHEAGSKPLMCNKLYSAHMLKGAHAKFNEALDLGEDHAFQFLVFPNAKVVSYTPAQLYFYRTGSGSAVGTAATDLNKRTVKHFLLVKYVITEWAQSGFLERYSPELAEWAIGFLYEDFRKCSFDVRERLSAEFAELTLLFPEGGGLESVSDAMKRRLDEMLSSAVMPRATPRISFVVSSHFGERVSFGAIESMLSQENQNVELLIDAAAIRDETRSLVFHDRRCRLIEAFTLERAVSQAAGEYAVFSSGNATYSAKTVDALGAQVDRSAKLHGRVPDVVVFDDALGIVGREDPLAIVKPNPALDEDLPFDIALSRFGGRHSVSLGFLLCDKAFNLASMRAAFDNVNSVACTPMAQVAELYSWLDRVCFSGESLMAFTPTAPALPGETESIVDIKKLQDVCRDFDGCREDFSNDGERAAFDKALDYLYESISQVIADFGAVEVMHSHLDWHQSKRVEDAREDSSPEYTDTQYAGLLEKRVSELAKLLEKRQKDVELVQAWASDADRRTIKLMQEVCEHEGSAIRRIGKTAMRPLRLFGKRCKEVIRRGRS